MEIEAEKETNAWRVMNEEKSAKEQLILSFREALILRNHSSERKHFRLLALV